MALADAVHETLAKNGMTDGAHIRLMVTRGTNLFIRGGALVATNNAPPASMGPALGEWWHESHGIYFGAKMRLNRFNPDGSLQAPPQIVSNSRMGDPFYRSAAEAARRLA